MEEGLNKDAIIHTQALSKSFGGTTAVHNLNLSVPAGSIFGFIGPSSCGKTTSVRLLLGIYTPDSGDVRVLQQSPQKFGRRERRQIGYMPQQFILYPELTVWENLNFAASLYGVSLRRKKRLQTLLALVELSGHEKKKVLLQDVMLRGQRPPLLLLLALFSYAALLFLSGWVRLSRQMARE